MSFGGSPTIVQLNKAGTTLIVGKDLDNTVNGDGANGVGKTTILNALCYVCYDKTISDISKDNLVNDINKKQMEVTVEFTKGADTYFINRQRKMKAGAAGNNVFLFKNGDDVTPDSMANTNVEIERVLGMPFDLFVRIVAFSANSTPFLDLPSRSTTQANQTDIIEGLFDLKMLSERADMLKAQMKDTEGSLKMFKVKLEQLDKEKARHAEQVASTKRRMVTWEKNRVAEMDEIEETLKSIEGIDFDAEEKLESEYNEVDDKVDTEERTTKTLETDIKRLEREIEKIATETAQLESNVCPYCNQEYLENEAKLKELYGERDVAKTQHDTQTHELEISKKEITKLKRKLTAISKKRKVDNLAKLLKVKNQAESLQQQLVKLEDEENPHLEAYEEILEVNLEDDVDNDAIMQLEKLKEHQKFLHQLLTKKDSFVRKTLLNKNIPFLNRRLHSYLTELGLPHTVEFTHELTAKITQFGREKDFGNLSNGQRARVNLALSLSFRDVLQHLHDHINFCMFDEVLDVGLDTPGVQAAAKMLKHKAREEDLCLFIISHRDEVMNAFDRNITVEMQKGFSYLNEGN